MKTNRFQRLLSLLLVVCMVWSMIPAFTLPTKATTADTPATTATEEPVIVIAGSDFQASTDELSASNVTSILTQIKADYTTADGFLFAGDYSAGTGSVTSVTALKDAVNGVYSGLADSENAVYVQGNHDPASLVGSTTSASGANDADAYGVYVINEDDFQWHANGTEEEAVATASALRSYLNEKLSAGYSKPIFVMSHIPLHYTMRTSKYGDGRYANYIFDVLNDSAAAGLNIIFLFGHHHSNSWLDSQGGSATYFAKGDKINIAQCSQTEYETETLNFTYMNAGYVGYYTTTNTTEGVETDLNMSVFEISGNEVKISRYTADGLHDLKSAGVANTAYSESWEPYTNVVSSPVTVELNQVTVDTSGIVVAAPGVTGVNVSVLTSNTPSGYSAYRIYDIEPVGYTKGDTAYVTVPLDSTYDTSRPVIVIDNDLGSVHSCEVVDGSITFTTNHFSDYTVAQADLSPVSATATMKSLKQATLASDLQEGVPYVISDYNPDWNQYQLTNSVGSYVSSSSGTFPGLLLDGKPSVDTEHVWYIKGGYLVYGSADSEEYLLITTSGVSIGAYDESSAAYVEDNPYSGTYGTAPLGIRSASGYLNRRGGGANNNVATYYGSYSGSYWHFNEIVTMDASLSVVPSLYSVKTSQTAVMLPTVTMGGESVDSYTIVWSSSDESVAKVSADGRVTPLKPGKVTITATLTEVEGSGIEPTISVEIPLNIYSVAKGGNVAMASSVMQTMEQVTNLEAGVASGPYVISSALTTSYKYLSGNVATSSRNVEGLELVTTNDFSHLWYYDGTYLRYNDPNGPYLAYEDGIIQLTTSASNAFDSVEANGNYYLIKNTTLSGSNCLNQSGGSGYNTVALYSDGNWIFNKVDSDNLVSLIVNPGNPTLQAGGQVELLSTVLLDGVLQSDYTLSWSVADPTVATVSDGTVTGVAAGKTTVTCTLTAIAGSEALVLLYVNIPIEVTAEEETEDRIIASGYTDKAMAQVTDLTAGVASGPYVISNPNCSPNSYLTGNGPVTSANCTGLEIVTTNDYKHLWYYDGTYLRYNAPDGPYLAYENGQVVLSYSDTYAFDDVHRLVNSDGTVSSGYTIQNTHISGYNCLNQLGGQAQNAAGMYYEYSGSRWYFNLVTLEQPVTLSVTPDTAAVYAGETVSLTPTVTVDGVHTSSYTINWASSDTSVATVADGVVTTLAVGRAIITATLTKADGLGAEIAVEIPISVLTLTQDAQSNFTLSTVLGPRPVLVTSLPEGISGPYLIDNRASGYILTGTEGVRSSATVGLWLKPPVAGDYTDLWYYDGTCLIYGDPNATDRYLVYENSMVGLGADTTLAFDTITLNSSGNSGSYTITASSLQEKDYKYLNQYGSGTNEAAGLYTMDGSSNAGSAWDFFSLTSESSIALTVYPTDGSTDLLITETKSLSSYLYVDGSKTTNYKLSYSVSDPSIALVGQDGTVYPQKSGTVIVYAQLTTLDGEAVSTEIIVPVTLRVCGVESVTINTKEGSLPVNASDRLKVSPATDGADAPIMTVTYENGVQKEVALTAGYLTDADGNEISTSEAKTFENLTVTYEGVVACTDFTLHVVKSALPDYPDHPDEGAVIVDKTATDDQNFQSSGLAQVELSVNGIPSKKGADVIIMLDTSSSMRGTVEGVTDERINVLCASLNNLINGFQEKAADGTNMDIRVAVADFNGFYHDEYSHYYIDPNDTLSGTSPRPDAPSKGKVYTGDATLSTGAFVKAQDFGLNPFTTNRSYAGETSSKYTLTCASGTNYDYAFDAVYQLGEAINDANAEAGEDRDLFVIFMSDGAPFQYNYFGAQSSSTYWSKYLMGELEDSMFATTAHKDYYHEDGKHWMAEAIKGERDQEYKVIRKNDYRDTDGDNFIYVNGLGATMYSIGFCLQVDGQITEESMNYVIEQIATGEDYSFFAKTADELEYAFNRISSDILYAASDAYFIDTMGSEYDLKLGDHEYVLNNTATTFTDNKIQVKVYEIYTQADYEAGNCTLNQIGVRKTDSEGNYIVTVLETVTFNSDGTKAYSDLIFETAEDGTVTYTNILIDGIINAKYFWYNSNAAAKNITLDSGTTYSLPAETFYWKVGTISTKEMALSYYVYLTNTQTWDGASRLAGIYPTNESAILYYENYLGNDCQLVAPIPTMPWGEAQVGYGFYLVDKNGDPIVNQPTGLTGSLTYAVKLGDSKYQEFTTNSETQVLKASDLIGSSNVPAGFKLFDPAAQYNVSLNSDGAGSIAVYTNGSVPLTTYITGLTSTPLLDGDVEGSQKLATNFATANTFVWFAVVATVEAQDDTIVVDFGLPVEIHPMNNDTAMSATDTVLGGIGKTDAGFSTTLDTTFLTTPLAADAENTALSLTYGKAEFYGVDTGSFDDAVIRYTLQTMNFTSKETFAYAAHYTGSVGTHGYYYGTITVIPATTIYYEDNITDANGDTIIKYTVWDVYTENGEVKEKLNTVADDQWVDYADDVDTSGYLQDEDRPGLENGIDADSVYGYDSNYTGFYRCSMFSTMAVLVTPDLSARANFTFTGTGFDVISMCSYKTCTIMVAVTDSEGNKTYHMVDTYYGYSYENGQWVVDKNNGSTMFQIPVIKVEGLDYGTYDVEIYAAYNEMFDHVVTTSGGEPYDVFYLDGIRIYDPADNGVVGTDTTIQDAYVADGEYDPTYQELRDLLINPGNNTEFQSGTTVNGTVFIDGKASVSGSTNASLADYVHYGPNNEVYLDNGQSVAFKMNYTDNVCRVMIALKQVRTNTKVKIYGLDASNNEVNAREIELNSATDLYYDISNLNGYTVVIQNISGTSGAIASITNIKTTHYPVATSETDGGVEMDLATAENVVSYLNSQSVVAPTLELSYPTISFEDEIFYNVYFNVDDMSSVAEMGLITFGSKLTDGTIADAVDVISGYTAVDGAYTARTNGIPAKNMGDAIYFKVYAKLTDGTYVYSDIAGYNAVAYANTVLSSDASDTAKALVVAMLNYGAAAQVQFGYNTDSLMNASFSDYQYLVAAYDEAMVDDVVAADSSKVGIFVNNGGWSNIYPSVSFEGAFSINYYFETAYTPDSAPVFYYWDAEAYANATELTAENATGTITMVQDGEQWVGTVDGIAAKQIDQTFYTAGIYTVGESTYTSPVIAYSLGGYCESIAASGNALGAALAVYGYYAESYFAS